MPGFEMESFKTLINFEGRQGSPINSTLIAHTKPVEISCNASLESYEFNMLNPETGDILGKLMLTTQVLPVIKTPSNKKNLTATNSKKNIMIDDETEMMGKKTSI